jgi:HSP20 family protein
MRELLQAAPTESLRGLVPGAREDWTLSPDFDVKETQDAYVFKADLPGIQQEDVEISVTGQRLTISGKREEEKREEGERYFTYERSHGSFARTFTVPEGVDLDNVNAELKEGVLTLNIPKRPEGRSRRIPIGSGPAKGKA